MADFFQTQLDFIFFVYGLAFILLGFVCFAIRLRAHWILPWSYLGLFGITHGTNEWLELLAVTLGDTPLFAWLRAAMLAAAFGFLVEFGRLGSLRLQRWAPGGWIYLPLLLLLAAGGHLGGQTGLHGCARYGLGVLGCLWAASALYHRAITLPPAGRLPLITASFAMAGYGMATGLVIPASPWLHAEAVNPSNFLTPAGPLLVARALLASILAISVWAYEQTRFNDPALAGRRRGYFALTTFILALVVGSGWVITEKLGVLYSDALRNQVRTDLLRMAEQLDHIVTRTNGLAAAMADSPALADIERPTPVVIAQLNRLVDRYSAVEAGLIANIVDRSGIILASSSRVEPAYHPIRGPYLPLPQWDLTEGMREAGFPVKLADTESAFYVRAPIRNRRGSVVGAVVLRRNLEVADLGLAYLPHAYLVGRHGDRLLSADAVPLGAPEATPALEKLLDGDRIVHQGMRYFVGRHELGDHGWAVVTLRQERVTLVSRLFGIVLTSLVSGLVLLASLMFQREIGTEMQFHQNQTRLEELTRRLELQAITDSLTGAHNRAKFNLVISSEIDRAARYRAPLSLIMYDIDFFKRVNDTYGHQTGDNVLVELTRLVTASIRESDLLARWGGEEFMIVVPESTRSDAARLAEKLRATVERHGFADVGHITCSFGVAEFVMGDTPETLIARSDQALYRAKTNGRNRVEAA